MARSEKVKIIIDVNSNGEEAVKKIKDEVISTDKETKQLISSMDKLSNSIKESNNKMNNVGSSAKKTAKEMSSMANIAGIMGKTFAVLSLGGLVGEIGGMAIEFDKLKAKMNVLTTDTNKFKKDFSTIINFEGISRFDPEDIQESYNLMRSQNIEFNEDLLKTISDTSLATNQNLVTVTEQFRAVLNNEEGSLDDYFKKVVKTTEGIVVQYTTKSGELKTKLLDSSEDLNSALKEQYSGVTKVLNKSIHEQARMYKEKFLNVILIETEKTFVLLSQTIERNFSEYGKTKFEIDLDKSIDDVLDMNIAIKNYQNLLKKASTGIMISENEIKNIERLEETIGISTEKRYKYNESVNDSAIAFKKSATDIKIANALMKEYIVEVERAKNVTDISKIYDKMASDKNKFDLIVQSGSIDSLNEATTKQYKILEESEKKKQNLISNSMMKQLEILESEGVNKEYLILLEANRKELEIFEGTEKQKEILLNQHSAKLDNFYTNTIKKYDLINDKQIKLTESKNKKILDAEIKLQKDILNQKVKDIDVDIGFTGLNSDSLKKDLEILNLNYKKQILLFEGSKKELILIDEKYQADKKELNRKAREEIEGLINYTSYEKTYEERYDSEMNSINDFYDEKLERLRELGATENEIKQATADRNREIADLEKQDTLNKVALAGDAFGALGDLLTTFGAENKKAFEIAKAANIAEATMNMYTSASKAWAQGGMFGAVGAGVALAAGAVNIANIQSQEMPKYHDGGYITSDGLSNESNATLQSGEGVLSRRGMKNLDELNVGGATNNEPSEIIIVNNMDEAIEAKLKSRSGRAIIKDISK